MGETKLYGDSLHCYSAKGWKSEKKKPPERYFLKKVKKLTLLVDTTLIICRASVDPCTLYAYLMKNIYNSYEQTLITCAPAYIQDKSKFVLMNRTHSFPLPIASNCFLMFQI